MFFSLCGSVYAQTDGRHLVDNLYTPDGKLPVRDLIADVEVYMPVEHAKEKNDASPAMTLSFKSKMIFKKPNKLKTDTLIVEPGSAMDGNIFAEYRDGQHRWVYSIVGQFPHGTRADKQEATLKLPPNLQTYIQDANRKHTITGKEQINGIDTTIVRIEGLAGEATIMWIDPVKRVPLKLERIPMSSGEDKKPLSQICLYGDFRQLPDGRWFPFQIEIKRGTATQMLLIYTALSINVGIGDEIFHPMEKFVK
jgi:hypothetical protein